MIDRIDNNLPAVIDDGFDDLPTIDQDLAERVDGVVLTSIAGMTRRAYRVEQLQHRATKEHPRSKADSFFGRIPKF